jgi:hypothetical protein
MSKRATRRRLTAAEWDVLLDAANAYEVEPANFENDADDKRLNALRRAIEKLQAAEGTSDGYH